MTLRHRQLYVTLCDISFSTFDVNPSDIKHRIARVILIFYPFNFTLIFFFNYFIIIIWHLPVVKDQWGLPSHRHHWSLQFAMTSHLAHDTSPNIQLEELPQQGVELNGGSTAISSKSLTRPIQFFNLRRLGAGILADIRARSPWYLSDWTDAWNYRVVPATALTFFSKWVSIFPPKYIHSDVGMCLVSAFSPESLFL